MKKPDIRLDAIKPFLSKIGSCCKRIGLKRFLVGLFAFIGVGATLSFVIVLWALHTWLTEPVEMPEAPETMVLALDFTDPIVDQPKSFSLSLTDLLEEGQETSLFNIVRAIYAAKNDPRVKGILARFDMSNRPLLAQAQEIATALQAFRASGKFTYSYAPSYGSFGNDSPIYYLASQFEHIWLQPIGSVGLTGIGLESPFVKSALAKIGVEGDFLRRREYKSIMETYTRDSYSQTVRENMTSLFEDIRRQLAEGIGKGLNIAPKEADRLIAQGPYTAQEALKKKLVTHLGYEDELFKEVEKKAGSESEVVPLNAYLYFAAQQEKAEPKAKVALIYAEGEISDVAPRGPSRFADRGIMNTDDITDSFFGIADDPDIKAIIFRINSPGGSPVASETIRHALHKAREAGKPVFVSMGPMAASGGYWIAMDADHIVADPASLTGSIGVVSGKFVFGGLAEKLGIKWDQLVLDDNALLWSMVNRFDTRGQERINAMLDETYQAFIQHVSDSRKIPMKKMESVARGRVFTGSQAVKNGLVDEVGGLRETIQAVKKHLKLEPEDKISLYIFPQQETTTGFVMKILRRLNLTKVLFEGHEGSLLADGLWTLREAQTALAPLWRALRETGSVRTALPLPFQQINW